MAADAFELEHVAPDLRQRALNVAERRLEATAGVGRGFGRRQRLAIHLAVRGERKGIQQNESCRNHVFGHGGADQRAQLIRQVGRRTRAHQVGDQALVARDVLARDDHRFAHGSVPGDACFDLPRLDAQTANLDLMVDATEKLDVAFWQPAHKIAGLVQPRARFRAERIRNELFCGELCAIPVARTQLRSAQEQLARHPDRHRPQVTIQHVCAGVGKRSAYGRCSASRAFGCHLSARAHHRVLGGTVMIDQPERQLARGPLVEPVTASEQGAQRRSLGPVLSQHCLRERRGQKAQGNLPLCQPAHHQPGIQARGVIGNMHAGARGEVRPDLPYRAVKGWSGDLRGTIVRLDVVSLLMPANQVEQARVLDRHPLRMAGRARGVNHIGELLRRHGAALEAAPGASVDAALRRVHVQNRRIRGGQGRGKMLSCQRHHRLRIFQHEANAFGGILRIDGHISPARFPHAQNGDEHLDRALEIDGDQGIRLHTLRTQLPGQCFRALVELPVGHPPPAAFRCERLRANVSLLLDQLVHAARRRIGHRGPIPELD